MLSGTCTSAGPNAATSAVKATNAAPVPSKAERHPRVWPTASTIVSASTISTHDAKNTAPTRTTIPDVTDVAMSTSGISLTASNCPSRSVASARRQITDYVN